MSTADNEASMRAKAPESLGRLELSFASKADLVGTGELARLIFQVAGTAAAAPIVGLESMSLTDASGLVVSTQLPPPLRLSISR